MGGNWTPGPWVVDLGCLKGAGQSRPIEVSGIGMAHFSANTGSREAQANAHLIAAAPELYEALEKCRDELASVCHSEFDGVWSAKDFDDMLAPYDGILRKARGETP